MKNDLLQLQPMGKILVTSNNYAFLKEDIFYMRNGHVQAVAPS